MSDDSIEAYYKRLNLPEFGPARQFKARLRANHGPEVASRALALTNGDPSPEGHQSAYMALGSDLRLSLEFWAGFSDIHLQYLRWFTSQPLAPPRRLLDLGCFNGFLTCFYALRYPAAEIVGIDALEEPIARARELAGLLKLSNVTFAVATVEDYANSHRATFDLVTAVTVLHEVVADLADLSNRSAWTIEELRAQHRQSPAHPALTAIAACLTTDGQLLSVDRIVAGTDLLYWDHIFRASGLIPSYERSGTIAFTSQARAEQVTALIALPKNGSLLVDDAMGFVLSHFYAKQAPGRLTDSWAEVVFDALAPVEVEEQLVLTYLDGSGVQRAQLCRKGELSLLYQATNRGKRTLQIGSSADRPRFLREMEDLEVLAWGDADVTRGLSSTDASGDPNEITR